MIDDDGAALIGSPCSLIVGTVDDTGVPMATRAWSVLVAPDRTHVRALLSARDVQTLANLRATGVIALTATHFITNDSVQVKGQVEALEAESEEDVARREEFVVGIKRELLQLDAPPELVQRLVPSEFLACVIAVHDVFDQTPGPTAGSRRVASRS